MRRQHSSASCKRNMSKPSCARPTAQRAAARHRQHEMHTIHQQGSALQMEGDEDGRSSRGAGGAGDMQMPCARTPGPLRRAPPHGTGNTTRAHGLPPTGKRSPDGEGGGQQEQDWQQRSACGGRQPPWQSRGERSVRRRPLFGESRMSTGYSKKLFLQVMLPSQSLTASPVKLNSVQRVQIRRMLYKNSGKRVNGGTILHKYGM